MGYRRPRPIQDAAIGPALAGRDVLGLAPTGTGKTAAFLIPVAHHLLSTPPPKKSRQPVEPRTRLRALVLCPTRELAIQVGEEAARICADSVLRVAAVYGKVSRRPQADQIATGVDLLIGTPGRVRELLNARELSLAFVRHVVIDEADRMLDLGFLPQVRALLEAVPVDRQTLFFTATMPPGVRELTETFLREPEVIEITGHTVPAGHVRQKLVRMDEHDKVPLLLHLLAQPGTRGVLVFCRTRRRVGWVGTALQRHGLACGMIHGDRSQTQRLKTLDRFAAGDLQVVVSTDVAARGLHIPAVRLVINYDLPNDPEEYVHRVGRAGHGGGKGASCTLLTPRDLERWSTIRRAMDVLLESDIDAADLPGFSPAPVASRKRGGAGAATAQKTAASRPLSRSKHAAKSTKTSRVPSPKRKRKKSNTQRKNNKLALTRPSRVGKSESQNAARSGARRNSPIRKNERPGKGVQRRNDDATE